MNSPNFFSLIILSVLFFVINPAQAQQSPSEYLGYELGERFTIFQTMQEYYRHLDEESDYVLHTGYGESVMGRKLSAIYVSSEENLQRKDEIRVSARHLNARTDELTEDELQQLVEDTPAVVWVFALDFANEKPGPEGMQQLVYELATSEKEKHREMRENLMMIFTPMTNPDGHAKHVDWHSIYDVQGSSDDPNAAQNTTPWGVLNNTNVNGINMNRDFSWFTIPETQALARLASDWNPQISFDLHAGPLTFFLTPTGPPFHPEWPDQNLDWSQSVADRAKELFSERDWLVSAGTQYAGITYIGHGITWAMMGPTLSGQFIESFGGVNPKIRRPDGTVATLEGALNRSKVSTWAMLQIASENREQLLRDTYENAISSAETAREHDMQSVIIPVSDDDVDLDKIERLVDRLTMQGVEVQRAEESFSVSARNFSDVSHNATREFQEGDFVVDLVQPYSRLARVLLDPTTEYDTPEVNPVTGRDAPYYEEQVENLPYMFGVDAYVSEHRPGVSATSYEEGDGIDRPHVANSVSDDAYGYIFPAGKEASFKMATTLMHDGFRVRVANAPFEIGDTHYPKGTWVMFKDRNPEGLGEKINQLVDRYQGEVVSVDHSFTDRGVTIANPSLIAPVPEPKVAVLADDPVSFDSVYGGIRNMLEWDLDFTFSPIRLETLNSSEIHNYTAVVLPDAAGYEDQLDKENLRDYASQGGNIIAVKGAAETLLDDEVLGANAYHKGRTDHIYGAIFRSEWHYNNMLEPGEWVEWEPGLETGQPLLSAGMPAEFAAPASNPVLIGLEEENESAAVLASYATDLETLKLDGFAWEPEREKVAGSPLLVDHPVGNGRVIYLADDITYRARWYGLNTMFLNTLVLSQVM